MSNTDLWQVHLEGKYGQARVGEPLARMDVLDRDDESRLKLSCTGCQTEFWSQIREGGQNCVVRQNVVCVQCPACGGEWDGRERRFFSLATLKDSVLSTIGSIEADDLSDAVHKLGTGDPIPTRFLPKMGQVGGILLREIGQDEHTLISLQTHLEEAIETSDPRLSGVMGEYIRGRRDLAERKLQRQAAGRTYRNQATDGGEEAGLDLSDLVSIVMANMESQRLANEETPGRMRAAQMPSEFASANPLDD